MEVLHGLFGSLDEHVKRIEKAFDVTISARDGEVIVRGADGVVESVVSLLKN